MKKRQKDRREGERYNECRSNGKTMEAGKIKGGTKEKLLAFMSTMLEEWSLSRMASS